MQFLVLQSGPAVVATAVDLARSRRSLHRQSLRRHQPRPFHHQAQRRHCTANAAAVGTLGQRLVLRGIVACRRTPTIPNAWPQLSRVTVRARRRQCLQEPHKRFGASVVAKVGQGQLLVLVENASIRMIIILNACSRYGFDGRFVGVEGKVEVSQSAWNGFLMNGHYSQAVKVALVATVSLVASILTATCVL